MRRLFVPFCLLAVLAMPLLAEEVSPELQATVPALSALHDVVAPLWHDAWPDKNNDEKGMLDGVEAVHAAFEGLVRVVKPPMKELDAYHQVLYTVYHKALPGADLAAIRTAGEELGRKCDALLAAPLPRRATGREEAVRNALASLCSTTAELRALPADAGNDAITAAVEKVHTAYLASEAAFE
jgi:hypothetical protein